MLLMYYSIEYKCYHYAISFIILNEVLKEHSNFMNENINEKEIKNIHSSLKSNLKHSYQILLLLTFLNMFETSSFPEHILILITSNYEKFNKRFWHIFEKNNDDNNIESFLKILTLAFKKNTLNNKLQKKHIVNNDEIKNCVITDRTDIYHDITQTDKFEDCIFTESIIIGNREIISKITYY